jgi:hypothetical protein
MELPIEITVGMHYFGVEPEYVTPDHKNGSKALLGDVKDGAACFCRNCSHSSKSPTYLLSC